MLDGSKGLTKRFSDVRNLLAHMTKYFERLSKTKPSGWGQSLLLVFAGIDMGDDLAGRSGAREGRSAPASAATIPSTSAAVSSAICLRARRRVSDFSSSSFAIPARTSMRSRPVRERNIGQVNAEFGQGTGFFGQKRIIFEPIVRSWPA